MPIFAIVLLVIACATLALPLLPPVTILWTLAGVFAAAGWFRFRLRGLCAAGMFAWVALSASAGISGRLPEQLAGTDATVTGRICEFPKVYPGMVRFVLDTDADASGAEIPARILVSWYEGTVVPQIGERWQLRLRLRAPRGTTNPGAFDFEGWLYARRIGATSWVRNSAGNRRLGAAGDCALAGWRGAVAARIAAAVGPHPALPYVLGLAVGAYQELPAAEWEILRRSGTTHLVSISGFHVGLVAIPFALLGLLVGRVLLIAGINCTPRLIAAWSAVAAAAGYGALAGSSVPTVRSVMMLLAVALLATTRRELRASDVVGLGAIMVLLVDPLAPLAPGFWLSFCGVVILCSLAGNGGERPAGAATGWRALAGDLTRRWLLRLLVAQLAVTVGLAPLLAALFGQFSLAGIPANLVAVPAFSLVIVPLVLAGTGLLLVSEPAGAATLHAAATGLSWWRAFTGWCSELPAANIDLPLPSPLTLALAITGAVWLLWPRPWPTRPLGLLLMAGLLAIPAAPADRGLSVTVMDVGQGLSVLVRTARHSLLYDAGPAYGDTDAGARVVVPVLRAAGLRRLDRLLISHADMDHRGGASSIIGAYQPAMVIGPDGLAATTNVCRAGESWHWDGVDFLVLHPGAGTQDLARSDNNGSCVLLVSAPGATVLLPGDIESRVERSLAELDRLPPADLVLAPHHGSRSSSDAAMVAATRPRFVVFATGFRNRWNFPAGVVVQRWRSAGACTLSTADEGALTFVADADGPLQLEHRHRADRRRLWRPAPPPPCD
jgi:competence protein ComEC